MRLHKPILLLMTCLLVGCASNSSTTNASTQTLANPEDMMEHLQDVQDPFELYQQAFTTYVFESQATLEQLDAKGSVFASVTSTSLLENLKSQYMHIERKPFSPVPAVEMLYLDGLYFLRPHAETTFYQIKFNPEVANLKKTMLLEVLSFFDLETLLSKEPKMQASLACYGLENQEICFDKDSHLPISGSLTMPQPQSSKLVLKFSVNLNPENITIQQPQKVHSLREHEEI